MSFKAVIFDCFGVLAVKSQAGFTSNQSLLALVERSLRPQFQLAVLSNTSQRQLERLLTQEQLSLFDELVLSAEAGMTKPDERIYWLTTNRLGLLPEDCLFVDDSAVNCAVANRLGMATIVYESLEQFEAELAKLVK